MFKRFVQVLIKLRTSLTALVTYRRAVARFTRKLHHSRPSQETTFLRTAWKTSHPSSNPPADSPAQGVPTPLPFFEPPCTTQEPTPPELSTILERRSEESTSAQFNAIKMAYQAEKELQEILGRIHKTAGSATNSAQIQPLLARAKINLLQLNALIPARDTPEKHLKLARDVFEAGAFVCIKFPDAEGFTRYFQQLQPFYDLPEEMLSHEGANKSRITGLYLLLLLSQGDTSGFHTMLERLINAAYAAEKNGTGKPLEDDEFIQYPRKLEEALSEGTYDRAWNMTMVEKVPGPEFAVFSDILRDTIRSEIASCAEVAYKNLSVRGAKNVLKLDSEGAVVKFAENRGWIIKDEHVYFPTKEADLQASERDNTSASRTIIENMLSYARQLENIV